MTDTKLQASAQLRKKQGGWMVSALIAVVLLVGAIGVYFGTDMGSGSSTDTGSKQAELYSSSILMQAGAIHSGIDLLIAQDGDISSADEVALDTSTKASPTAGFLVGLFGSDGTMNTLVPPHAAYSDPSDAGWDITTDATLAAVGTVAADTYITVSGITAATCAKINTSQNLATAAGATNAAATATRTIFCDPTDNTFYKVIDVN